MSRSPSPRKRPASRVQAASAPLGDIPPAAGQSLVSWPSLPTPDAFGLSTAPATGVRAAPVFDGRRRGVPPLAPPSISTGGRGVSPDAFEELERINSQALRLHLSQQALEASVIRARDKRVGWDLIGQAVGLSGEGARSRWGR